MMNVSRVVSEDCSQETRISAFRFFIGQIRGGSASFFARSVAGLRFAAFHRHALLKHCGFAIRVHQLQLVKCIDSESECGAFVYALLGEVLEDLLE